MFENKSPYWHHAKFYLVISKSPSHEHGRFLKTFEYSPFKEKDVFFDYLEDRDLFICLNSTFPGRSEYYVRLMRERQVQYLVSSVIREHKKARLSIPELRLVIFDKQDYELARIDNIQSKFFWRMSVLIRIKLWVSFDRIKKYFQSWQTTDM